MSILCRRAAVSGACLGLLILASLTRLSAQEPEAKPETEAIESFKKQAADYTVEVAGSTPAKATLIKAPVLHWGNPARTGEDGAVFVWTSDGRPVVIGSIFTYKGPGKVRTKHEFQSVASGPLKATYNGQVAWTPSTAGVDYQPVPGAPAPAASARLRLTQMRQLARTFSGKIAEKDTQTSELRLMPNALYRYEVNGKGDVVDGAVFALALGTDPEILLLLEARKAAVGGLRWEYALGRFHFAELWASCDGKQVWHVDRDDAQPNLKFGDATHQSKPYVSYHVD